MGHTFEVRDFEDESYFLKTPWKPVAYVALTWQVHRASNKSVETYLGKFPETNYKTNT